MQENDIFDTIEAYENQGNLPESGKPIVCMYGLTGNGKSALINYLLKNELTFEKRGIKYIITKVNTNQKGPKIGNQANSESRMPSAYPWINNQELFDLPGNNDTGGHEMEIKNAILIKNCLKKGLKIKLMLIVSIHQLESGRGMKFFDSLQRLQKLFGPNFKGLTSSLSIVISKISSEFEKGEAGQLLGDCLKENKNNLSKQAFELIDKAIQEGRLFEFKNPDHKDFQQQLNRIQDSLASLSPFCMQSDSKSSLTIEAIEILKSIQREKMNQYLINLQMIENKLQTWCDEVLSSKKIDHINKNREKVLVIKGKIEEKQSINFGKINSSMHLGFPQEKITNMFTKLMKNIKLCSLFTGKKEDFKAESMVRLLDTFARKLHLKMEELQEKERLRQIEIEKQRRRKEQEQEMARKMEQQRKRIQRQEEQRRIEAQRAAEEQRRAIEAENKRREEEKRRLQKQLQEERQRRRRQEQEARRKQSLRPEQKVEREVKRIGKQIQNVGKKLFRW